MSQPRDVRTCEIAGKSHKKNGCCFLITLNFMTLMMMTVTNSP